MSSRRIPRALERWAERAFGRTAVARFGRFINNEVRRDGPNRLDENGEQLVQRVVLAHAMNPVVIDVGAHFGEWSLALLRNARRRPLELHAFEPSAFNFERLSRQIGASASVNHLAASDRSGELAFYSPHEGAESGTVSPFAEVRVPDSAIEASQSETVRAVTLDEYCHARDIDHVALIKVDAEGHDLAVLRGATGLIDAQKVEVIQFEYSWRWVAARAFLDDVFSLLQPRGYRIGKITPTGIEFYEDWHFELETFREANYLACRPPWLEHFPTLRWWNEKQAEQVAKERVPPPLL